MALFVGATNKVASASAVRRHLMSQILSELEYIIL